MNKNNGKPDPEQGLYRKFNVERVSDPTGKHKDCVYYVLDLDHDKHSVAALLAYAASCEAEFPTLAFDLRHTAAATARKLGVVVSERVPICRMCGDNGYIEAVGSTTGERHRYKCNHDGSITVPFAAERPGE